MSVPERRLMLLYKGFEVDADQGEKKKEGGGREEDHGRAAWGCSSYDCSIINVLSQGGQSAIALAS